MGDLSIQCKYLWHLVYNGALEKYGNPLPDDRLKRLCEEMSIIVGNGFTDYILIVWDIHDFCRDPKRIKEFCEQHGYDIPETGVIPLGPGRGSVGGSSACYCIDIHECDPEKFGLFFERFLNPERIAYPDIDFDISQKHRPLVLQYVQHKYGNVAQIITYSTLSVRSLTEELLKSAGVSKSFIKMVKDTIPDDTTTTVADVVGDLSDPSKETKFIKALKEIPFPDLNTTIKNSQINRIKPSSLEKMDHESRTKVTQLMMGMIPTADVTVKSSWTWQRVVSALISLEKLNKHESVHSGGIVVSPTALNDNVPLMKKDGSGVLASQYDMIMLEKMGYLKMDALGLRTVDVNHDAEAMVRKWYDNNFDIKKVPYNDPKAIDLIRRGDTVGIFQIESSGFTKMMIEIFDANSGKFTDSQYELLDDIEGLKLDDIDDFMWISAGLAMYRPGPLDAIIEGKTMVKHLIDRKAGIEPVVYMFDEEIEYLSETYGVMIYQEQVMARVRQMTGCTLGRADVLRKAMGKKNEVLMKAEMDWFENSAMAHDFTARQITEAQKHGIVSRAREEIEKFARYGFNKAHTVEYGHICYRNAYLKANYPVPFYTALLNSEISNQKRLPVIIRDMMRHNMNLLPPLVNVSGLEFIMSSKDEIRFGLSAISGLGDNGTNVLLADRNERGKYKSIEDFRVRIPGTAINKNVLLSLAQCGAFDDILGDYESRATLVNMVEEVNEKINKLKQKKKNKQPLSYEELMKKVDELDIWIVDKDEDLIEYAIWEKKILKMFISAHPIDAYVDEIERWTAIDDMEIEEMPDEFYIAGFVAGMHTTTIKKEGRNKGKEMGFVTIETINGQYEATLFPGIYETCLPYAKTGNAVVLKGKKSYYNGSWSIQGVYMRNLMNTGIRDCPECHIVIEHKDFANMIALKQMFDEHTGNTDVTLHVMSKAYMISINIPQKIALNDRIIDYVNTIGKVYYKQPNI